MAYSTYKPSFNNMLQPVTEGPQELTQANGFIDASPSYGVLNPIFTASEGNNMHLSDNGQFKNALMLMRNAYNTSNGSLQVEIKVANGTSDANNYTLYNYINCGPNGFLSLMNSEIPLYMNGYDVELYHQRGGSGWAQTTTSIAEYHYHA